MNNKIHDEYATKPIFIRAIEYLGQLQIDVRRIKTTPYHLRPPTPLEKRYEQIDQSLCAIPERSSSIRFSADIAKILEEKYNKLIRIYMDDSKKDEKVGCSMITPDQKFRKRLKPKNTVYSAEQEAIIKAIYVTQRTGERRVVITDSLSTLMAVEGDINSKNPKTLSLRKLMDEKSSYGNTRILNRKRRRKSFPGSRPISHRKIPTT
jgi:hypothetical protein